MEVINQIKTIISSTVKELTISGHLPPESNKISKDFTVEPVKNHSNGDFASNIAFLIAKLNKERPFNIAKIISKKLSQNNKFKYVEPAEPGFINIFLSSNFISEIIKDINNNKNESQALDQNKTKINIEFVSANPTGPMHIGHARGAIIGDVLSNVFKKIGFNVTKEFYINDAGSQIEKLAESVYLRYTELLGQDISNIDFSYPGEYIIDIAKEIKDEYGDSLVNLYKKYKENAIEKISKLSVEKMINVIKNDLKLLGVEHDVFTSEKSLHANEKINESVNFLKSKNLIYYGTPTPPKGKLLEDWEPRKQMMFKATEFGDTEDRALTKSDDSWTYFAVDIAYHFDKYMRGFNKMVLVLGKDHDGYRKRITAATKAVSNNNAELNVVFYDIVNLFDNGHVVKMSKRKGNILGVYDVVSEVGKDIARFNMISIDSSKILDFDFFKVKEQTMENRLFYIQYAYARCTSTIKKITNTLPEISFYDANLSLLDSREEILIMCSLAMWQSIIKLVATSCEPHHICIYLNKVASYFHAFWNAGKINNELRLIIESDQEITKARLALVHAVKNILSSGLRLLGISPMENM